MLNPKRVVVTYSGSKFAYIVQPVKFITRTISLHVDFYRPDVRDLLQLSRHGLGCSDGKKKMKWSRKNWQDTAINRGSLSGFQYFSQKFSFSSMLKVCDRYFFEKKKFFFTNIESYRQIRITHCSVLANNGHFLRNTIAEFMEIECIRCSFSRRWCEMFRLERQRFAAPNIHRCNPIGEATLRSQTIFQWIFCQMAFSIISLFSSQSEYPSLIILSNYTQVIGSCILFNLPSYKRKKFHVFVYFERWNSSRRDISNLF